jgi:hypothetical protein
MAVYLFTGQPGSGKTTLAKKLQFWLQTDKKNWRKSVFHIDENQTEHPFEVALYLDKYGNDVVLSLISPNREIRENFKSKSKVIEIYCQSKKMRNQSVVENYEPPIDFFVDLDTSDSIDITFNKLIKLIS